MSRKSIFVFAVVMLFAFESKAQIIDCNCPFHFLPIVVFDKISTTITKDAKAALDSLASYLFYNPTCSLDIVGSSYKGSRNLTKRRLASIIEYLEEKDIRRNRLFVVSNPSMSTTKISFKKHLD